MRYEVKKGTVGFGLISFTEYVERLCKFVTSKICRIFNSFILELRIDLFISKMFYPVKLEIAFLLGNPVYEYKVNKKGGCNV